MVLAIIPSLTSLATTLLLSIAQGQTNLTFDPSSISLIIRTQWCAAESNTCGVLCSGTTNVNTCDDGTLDCACICESNNSAPGLQYYEQTMPTFICEQNFKICNLDALNQTDSAAAQAACAATEQADCGHLDPANFTALAVTTSSISSVSSSSSSSPSTSSPSRTGSSSTPNSLSTSTSSSNSATSSPQPPQSHNGLSAGVKAGIGVGVAVGVLIFILGLWLAFWYGRRTRSSGENAKSKLDKGTGRKAELEASEISRAQLADVHEMGEPLTAEEKQELENRRRAAELEGESVAVRPRISERAELEARRRGDIFELS
jgi:hypothetical protein